MPSQPDTIKWFCNRCDRIIVPTEKIKKELAGTGIRTGIEVVPTGVDLDLIRSENPSFVRRKHGIPEHGKVLLFAGRLAKEKNLPFLFKAFETIISQSEDTYLLLAAGGPMRKELEKIAPKNVIFAGEIKYPEILDYYAASDIFVFSSLSETQGLVLVEAMASGLPQVAVDAEGVSDVVRNGKTGYLTQLSIDGFSSKVLDLLGDAALRRKMSDASKDVAKIGIFQKSLSQAKLN